MFEEAGDSSGSNFEVTEVVSFIFEQSGNADAYGLDINTVLGSGMLLTILLILPSVEPLKWKWQLFQFPLQYGYLGLH